MLYSSQPLKNQLRHLLSQKISQLSEPLALDVIQVGNNLASNKYIGIKQKIGQKLGIQVYHHQFSQDSEALEKMPLIWEKIKSEGRGVIFQLPISKKLEAWLQQTPATADVDLLSYNSEKLWQNGFLPPTVKAVDLALKDILEELRKDDLEELETGVTTFRDWSGWTVALVGQGRLVGWPLTRYFRDRGATILSLNKFTPDIKNFTQQADIIISGAGSPELLNKTWVNPQAIVIDAGTTEIGNHKLAGDVDTDNLYETNKISPSPGGIGGLTVLSLFWNLWRLKVAQIDNTLASK